MTEPSTITPEVVARWLRIFVRPGQVTELRCLNCKRTNLSRAATIAGFFDSDHLEDMARIAMDLSPKSEGVYFLPNPLNPDLLARRYNRVDYADRGTLATDRDVLRRQFLLIDCDPVRISGVSSTDHEKLLAMELASLIAEDLRFDGWIDPVIADSGNGVHLLYPLCHLKDHQQSPEYFSGVLHGIADCYETPQVKVDRSVFNAARIVKLYGTWARKGDSTPSRPHRQSRILRIPHWCTDL